MAQIAGLLLFAAVVAGFGQTQTVGGGGGRAATFTSSFPGSQRFAPPAVQGMPYSAEEIQERQQTLSDGTHIQQTTSHQMMFRDAQGRTRTERSMMMRPDGQAGPVIIQITDPVTGVQYTLDTQNKVAHRVTLQPFPAPGSAGGGGFAGRQGTLGAGIPAPASTATAVSGSNVAAVSAVPVPPTTMIAGPGLSIAGKPMGPRVPPTIEKLGTQVLEGVLAEGQRQTMTIPAGSQGNDRDIHIITETWTSPDLKMDVYRKMSDPRTGENVMRLTNISRNDPDPQLFQPPPDYQMVDESGPFSIRFQQ